MAERPSTRAGGAHRATIPPGFPRTAPSRWRAIRWVSRATSCSKAGRRARSSNGCATPLRKGAKHDRAGTTEGCDGRAPDLGRRLQRSRTAGDSSRLRGRGGRRAVATEVQPGRGPGFDLPHGCDQPQRSARHPGAALRRTDSRHSRAGRPVGLKAARPPVVSIHELGTLGGAVSQAKAVNRAGQVVGTSRDALGRTRAFLWQENVGIVDLKPLTGVNTSANDVNENGEITGGGDTGFGDFHAYLLSEGTSFDLGTLGGNESEALAVNRRGQVAGHSRIAGAVVKHAFLIADPGSMVDLGSLGGGGAMSIAHDVNDAGAVVGLAETSTGRPHAFLWTAADGLRDLGALGAAPSMALGINNRREVVGGSGHAFLWTERAGIVDLGTLGGRTSCANDINDLGCIVGVSQTDRTDARGLPVTRAFLRTPDGSMLDLGTLGGEHSSAAAISEDDGGVVRIAGHSHDDAAAVRAVVWTVRLT